MYNGMLEFHMDYVSVYDREFESSFSFYPTREELTEAYRESPEYFTDEILVTLDHYIKTGEKMFARQISSDFETKADLLRNELTIKH